MGYRKVGWFEQIIYVLCGCIRARWNWIFGNKETTQKD